MPWPVLASRTVYDNAWIRVREDQVIRPDQARGVYGVVEVKQPAVSVVALTEDDEIWLLTIDRHTVGPSTEVVAGGSDEDDLLEGARRELAEEIGLAADDWVDVGSYQTLNGVCRAPGTVFLARGLSPAPGQHAPAMTASEQRREGISQARPVPVPEVLAMIREARITDAETLAALMLVLVHLGRIA